MNKFVVYQTREPTGVWEEASEAIYNITGASRRRKLKILPTLEVQAVRWCNRQGQTYHSVYIWQEHSIILRAEEWYGNDNQYAVTACKLLENAGLIRPEGGSPTIRLREANIDYQVADVKLKKQLFRS